MYLPSLQATIIWVTAPVAFAWALVNFYPSWQSWIALIVISINTMLAASGATKLEWLRFLKATEDDERNEKQDPKERLKIPDLNKGTVYEYKTDVVTLDVERNFCKMLVSLWHDDKVDYKLTEDWWWKTGRWKQCGGSSKKQLQNFLKDLEGRGWLTKKNKLAANSTRKETNRRAIIECANGRHSPS